MPAQVAHEGVVRAVELGVEERGVELDGVARRAEHDGSLEDPGVLACVRGGLVEERHPAPGKPPRRRARRSSTHCATTKSSICAGRAIGMSSTGCAKIATPPSTWK